MVKKPKTTPATATKASVLKLQRGVFKLQREIAKLKEEIEDIDSCRCEYQWRKVLERIEMLEFKIGRGLIP